jgi:hypothetical protein
LFAGLPYPKMVWSERLRPHFSEFRLRPIRSQTQEVVANRQFDASAILVCKYCLAVWKLTN